MESKVDLWLAQLGLSEYAQAFAENHVDCELLPRLTAEDLRDIGISSVGHRRRLLDAIAHLAVNAPPQMPVEPEKAAQPRQERAAERRRLSVMFCDLVGSTGLSQRLDPEELSEVIRIYQNTVAGEVARYEGHVAKFMGDGVMALFGYPQAHEDDCERAIRSALSLVDAIGSLKPIGEHTLQIRIGISTGDVVVGDLVGEGAAQEEAVVGDTPNLAARLQELATAGHVAIDSTTQRAVRRIFALNKLGKHALKGFEAEVEAWQVSGEHQTPTRFETNHQTGMAEFVGRQHELGLLLERWQLAREGEGQVVLLSGEAGIGKSRLVRAMTDAAKHDELIRLTYQCSPYHINSSLYPVLRHLERAAEFTPIDDDDARYSKLERLFSSDAVPFIANLYSLISVDDERIRSLRADERKEKILGILSNQLMRLADEKPVLFLFEDAHWIDPTTLELLNQTVPNIFDQRLLMVLTHRPEWKAPFSTAPHVTQLALNPLSRSQVEDLVRALAGPATDETIIQSIVARTDGVPLFVEELTKSIVEAADTSNGVPESLQASLLARLDRLGDAREVAQAAAAIGRDFTRELLDQVIEKSPWEMDAAIEQLLTSELVYARGTVPETRYTFKHALVQDTAYSTMLVKQRRRLHERIAKTLQESSPAAAGTEPEIIAHHLTSAGLNEQAVEYWDRAARRAAAQSANIEAVDHFRTAIELLSKLPENARRRRAELHLQLGLGPALMAVHGWGNQDVAETYGRARTLGAEERDIPSLFQATWGLWLFYQSRSAHQQARQLTSELMEYAAGAANTALDLQAHHATWTTNLFTGEVATAIQHCEAGLRLYDKSLHRNHALQYGGHDPCVCGHVQGAMMHWLFGQAEQAERHNQKGLALAEELEHRTSLVHAHLFSTRYRMMRNEPLKALGHAEQTIIHGKDMGLQLYTTVGEAWRGWALVRTGDLDAGLGHIKGLITEMNAGRARLPAPLDLAFFADALAANEEYDAALMQLADALKLIQRTGERFWEPEIHRLQGEFLWRKGSSTVEEIRERFVVAIEESQSIAAKALELRAASSLARLMLENGDTSGARRFLEPVYNWFTEGHDTPDMKNAKKLLEAMA